MDYLSPQPFEKRVERSLPYVVGSAVTPPPLEQVCFPSLVESSPRRSGPRRGEASYLGNVTRPPGHPGKRGLPPSLLGPLVRRQAGLGTLVFEKAEAGTKQKRILNTWGQMEAFFACINILYLPDYSSSAFWTIKADGRLACTEYSAAGFDSDVFSSLAARAVDSIRPSRSEHLGRRCGVLSTLQQRWQAGVDHEEKGLLLLYTLEVPLCMAEAYTYISISISSLILCWRSPSPEKN
ncbi:hypothetical protein HPB50_025372 [Hyalomma asiaticum]|uniref:Uncharacterized protein n=1 Tax=Hyalomma asiaticum TaxID=266040 RepID=A0ACB7S232_HYAAI|nr:hypothetical protein HPB50_025372 [Hyalomma asiaticum]